VQLDARAAIVTPPESLLRCAILAVVTAICSKNEEVNQLSTWIFRMQKQS
jgi:hypothetical protein